jgi:hypothetical protein
MIFGLAAYAMKRCSMKRKSIISDTQNLPGYVRTKMPELLQENMGAKHEGQSNAITTNRDESSRSSTSHIFAPSPNGSFPESA